MELRATYWSKLIGVLSIGELSVDMLVEAVQVGVERSGKSSFYLWDLGKC